MHNTDHQATPDTEPRFQCRHILTDGRRCASPCLRNEEFCYFHHNTRKPVPIRELEARQQHREVFTLPDTEDRSAIQQAIGEVLRRVAANDIDPRRAGLLLYGLQIASLNLPKQRPDAQPLQPVEDIVIDPVLGTLAPRAEVRAIQKKEGPAARMLRELNEAFPDDEPDDAPTTLRTLRAAAAVPQNVPLDVAEVVSTTPSHSIHLPFNCGSHTGPHPDPIMRRQNSP